MADTDTDSTSGTRLATELAPAVMEAAAKAAPEAALAPAAAAHAVADGDTGFLGFATPFVGCIQFCGDDTVDRYLAQLMQDCSRDRHMFMCKRVLSAGPVRAVSSCIAVCPDLKSITLSGCGVTCSGESRTPWIAVVLID